MIHYHGTPITPLTELYEMEGRHFCIAFPRPDSLPVCLKIASSIMFDNGAFSIWKRDAKVDWSDYYFWVSPMLRHPHWMVIPDVINGSEEENDALLASCKINKAFAAPVWHLNENLSRLSRLVDNYPRVCLGSTAEAEPGSPEWARRIDAVFNLLARRNYVTWIHMLRAMEEASSGGWPFASADSTNVARNFKNKGRRVSAEGMAKRLDGRNPRLLDAT